ncbi:MAG: ketopantoate reductase family protein [Anaerolineales bacterium]|nr:ketopantoate reductase family protein [Anaerolineales bacterium]
MKILVYGAGAVGGFLGARLAQDGHDVTLIVRQVVADAIKSYGLIVTQDNKRTIARPHTLTSIPQAFQDNISYDLIILGMKSYDIKAALDPLVAFCPDPPMIMTTQNGIGIERILADQYGAEQIVAGSFTISISKETTNQITVENEGGLGLAPIQSGQNIKSWVKMFQHAGIDTASLKNHESMKWSKALLNIVGNATSAILNRPPKTVYKSEAIFDLEMRMLREAIAVMNRRKIKIVNLPGWSPNQLVFSVRRLPKPLLKPVLTNIVSGGRGDKMPSFYIDLNSGKNKSEVGFHNGAIAQAGQQVRVPTPVNAALADVLIKITREQYDWREFDGRPKRLLAEVHQWEKRFAKQTGKLS